MPDMRISAMRSSGIRARFSIASASGPAGRFTWRPYPVHLRGVPRLPACVSEQQWTDKSVTASEGSNLSEENYPAIFFPTAVLAGGDIADLCGVEIHYARAGCGLHIANGDLLHLSALPPRADVLGGRRRWRGDYVRPPRDEVVLRHF